jgi:nucleoside-diphosphate kinase
MHYTGAGAPPTANCRRYPSPHRLFTSRVCRAIQPATFKEPIPEGEQMAIERTFSMIKPDATKRNLTGAITKMLEDAGLRVVASRRVWMSRREAEGFYAVHKGRPFFDELCEFMSSGPTVVQVLEGENAIAKNREVMGATNPANAAEGTIRKIHALSIGENSVHGSDAPETAAQEIRYWFSDTEIVG